MNWPPTPLVIDANISLYTPWPLFRNTTRPDT